MESNCCIRVVKNELDKLGLHYKNVELGRVEIKETLTEERLKEIDTVLKSAGLELISDSKSILVEKVKIAVHNLVYLSDDLPRENFSEFISSEVRSDYTYLSSIFSNIQGVTVEKYVIGEKIERVKNMLVYEQISLNEIAYKLKYSSVAHLSNQFKRITGMTPSSYRGLMFTDKGK